MLKENANKKAVLDVYKNAHIALQSLNDLIPSVNDKDLKKELKAQADGYTEVINEVKAYLKKKKIKEQDIGVLKKAMLWSSIKMKTLFDNSRNQVAEMMINGTVMGINELNAMKNEGENLEPEILSFVKKLLHLEEEYQKRLKAYL
jgi:hypothetical protein